MDNQRFTAVKVGLAAALVGTVLAGCEPTPLPPQQVQAANPTVTYKYRGDQELVNANSNATAFCARYQGSPRTVSLSNDADGNRVVAFECVPTPATTVVTAPPGTVVTSPGTVVVPPGVAVAPTSPLVYTYATDQELLNASANAQAYCSSRGMARSTSTVVTNSNGTRTITFQCGPA